MNTTALITDQKNMHARTKRVMKILGNALFVVLMLIVAVVLFFTIQSKFAGNTPGIAGYKLYIVLSGSMEPELHTGSLVIVKPADPIKLAVNDIITFRSLDNIDALITHRIVAINSGENLSFATKGDANDVNDPQSVLAANVVGKVSFSLPYVGYVLNFARSKMGLLLLVILPGVVLIILELRKLYKLAIQLDREKQAKKQAELGKATVDERSDASVDNTQT